MLIIRATNLECNLITQKFKWKMFKIESQNWTDNQHWANSEKTMGLNLQPHWRKILLIMEIFN